MTHGQREYWGLRTICRRMGWKHARTPVRQAMNNGFPLYLKVRNGQTRQIYYSTERLILAWEWSKCEREIERLTRNGVLHETLPYSFRIEETSPDLPLP